MRIAPTLSQDVDMRFLGPPPNLTVPPPTAGAAVEKPPPVISMREIASPDAQEDRLEPSAVIDYSQYLKEANIEVGKSVEDVGGAEDEPKLLIDDTWCGSDDDEESALKIAENDDEDDNESDGNEDEKEEAEEERNEDDKMEDENSQGKPSDEAAAPSLIPTSSYSYWPMNLAPLNKVDLSASVSQIFNQSEQQSTVNSEDELPKPDTFCSMYGGEEKNDSQHADDQAEAQGSYNPAAEDPTPVAAVMSDPRDPRMRLDPRDPRNSAVREQQIKSPPPPAVKTLNILSRPSMYDIGDDESADEDTTSAKIDKDMRISSFFMDSSNEFSSSTYYGFCIWGKTLILNF